MMCSRRAPEPDLVDAVVVEDELPDGWLAMNNNDPVAARRAFEQFKQAESDRERRQSEPADGWRTGRGDGRGGAIYETFREPGISTGGGI